MQTQQDNSQSATYNFHPDVEQDPAIIRNMLSRPIKVMSVIGMIYRINLTIEESHESSRTNIPIELSALMEKADDYIEALLSSSPYHREFMTNQDAKLVDNLVEAFAQRAGWVGDRRWKRQQTLIQMVMAITDDMISAQPPIVRYQPARTKFERLIDIMSEMLDFFIKSDGQRFAKSTESGASRGSLFFQMLFGDEFAILSR